MANLGIATDKHRYDLPLNKDSVASFQIQMTALMVTLACWALAGFMSLDGLSNYWISGLKDNITIELSPIKQDQTLYDSVTLEARAEILRDKMENLNGIESVSILPRKDVANMIGDWIGDDTQELPLPILVSVKLNDPPGSIVEDLNKLSESVHENTIVNTHQAWLSDFLKTAYFLRYGALVLCFVMVGALVLSIRGIVKARMAAYARDIELLHLIGASDSYISKQFQRHAAILALKSQKYALGVTIIGLLIAYLFLSSASSLPEDVGLSVFQFLILIIVPLGSILLSALTARKTAKETLNNLP